MTSPTPEHAAYLKAWSDFIANYGDDVDEAVFQAGWIMRGIADTLNNPVGDVTVPQRVYVGFATYGTTPEAMRTRANELDAERGADATMAASTAEMLRYAAIEIKTMAATRTTDERLVLMQKEIRALRDALAEYATNEKTVAILRGVIANAPHAGDCWLREDPDEGVLPEHRKCTCWKADAP